jgi:RNA polymerase sigma-70 factor (ECF subfamily)
LSEILGPVELAHMVTFPIDIISRDDPQQAATRSGVTPLQPNAPLLCCMVQRCGFYSLFQGEGHVHDQNLPAALAADVDGSFEPLVLAFQDRLYAFALRLTGSPQDAEEITQDTFVRAYKALTKYPAARIRVLALQPWLYQITLNVFRNRARHRQLEVVSLAQGDEEGEREVADDTVIQPDTALEHAELKASLGALVAALPQRYRLAVVLRYIQGLAYGEMALVLQQPIGTIKANVHRGVRRLREALDEQERTGRPRPQLQVRRGVK